jgi:DNA-binding transcriptional MerR regulator
MASTLSQKRAPGSAVIPDRLYFKIGDVARICQVEPFVLRFWETQFPQLKPNKGGAGHRLYRRRDVEVALEIKRLVHAEGYTLSGARQVLERGHQRGSAQAALPLGEAGLEQNQERIAAVIGHARAELREIAGLLAAPLPQPVHRRSGRAGLTRLATLPPSSGSLFPS